MENVAAYEAFQEIKSGAVFDAFDGVEAFDGLPDIARRVQFLNADGGGIRAWLQNPGPGDALQISGDGRVINGGDKLRHAQTGGFGAVAHQQFVAERTGHRCRQARQTQSFTGDCGSHHVVFVQRHDALNLMMAHEIARGVNIIINVGIVRHNCYFGQYVARPGFVFLLPFGHYNNAPALFVRGV